MSDLLRKIFSAPIFRLILVIVSAMCLVGILIVTFFLDKQEFKNLFTNELTVTLVTLAITALTFLLMSYLQSDNKKYYSQNDQSLNMQKDLRYMLTNILMKDREVNQHFINEIRDILKVQKEKEIELTTSEKEKLLNIIEDKIESSVVDKILETFQKKYSEVAMNDSKYEELAHDFYDVKFRLEREISKLTLRANLNLAIGSATTIFAIFVLWFTVVNHIPDFKNMENIISILFPRISLVIFIEIFAFFFLKLYKSNLFDIKYYHNEMTNCDFKVLALKTAFVRNLDAELPNVIDSFLKVERNFVLKKGESTLEIEKEKLDNKLNNKLFGIIQEILSTKSK